MIEMALDMLHIQKQKLPLRMNCQFLNLYVLKSTYICGCFSTCVWENIVYVQIDFYC